MKEIVKKIILIVSPLMLILLSVFYEKKYLKGRHFDKNISGYLYSIRSI